VGHKDYTLPGGEEGYALYKSQDAGKLKGTFKRASAYWLASSDLYFAEVQKFAEGGQGKSRRYSEHPVRFIRKFTI
jgi:hypothetical protein